MRYLNQGYFVFASKVDGGSDRASPRGIAQPKVKLIGAVD